MLFRPVAEGRSVTDSSAEDHAPAPARRLQAVDGLQRRREAISDLGDALRLLVEYATTTEAPTEELRRAAERIRQAAAPLGERVRTRDALSTADDLFSGVRMYNPVTGSGSALAPPVHIFAEDGVAVGTCTLGMAFEGPPTYAHGGVSAMLLDQILGYAVGLSGNPGMTVRLDTTYRKPVPLLTPLRLTAPVQEINGRRVTATGNITAADAPGVVLVEATGVFQALRAEQAKRLFGRVIHATRSSRAG
jgi:acyl-coenzyme A thioesterase PaaI-like protein